MPEKDGNNGELGLAKKLSSSKNSYSEEWRNECEARDLLTWPLAKRRKQLALVLEKRGEAGYYKLTEEMTRQWTAKQNKHTQPPNILLTTEKNLPQPIQGELL
jgi:hypothetical protein